MSFEISERFVQGVTILDCDGRVTLGEGHTKLRDTVRKVVREGKKNLLLNLGKVRYIDSSGNGELVSAFTTATNSGGSLKLLLNLNKKLRDILQITKLYTVYEVFDDEAAALRSFGAAGLFHQCRCPMCGFRSTPPLLEGEHSWPLQNCFKCGAEFTVEQSDATPPDTVLLKNVAVEGDWEAYYRVVFGPPYTIEVPRRLTLFSTHALQKIWKVIPKPRRVMFDLDRVTEIESGGKDALLALSTEAAEESKLVISLEGLSPKLAKEFPARPPFYAERSLALGALGDIFDTPPLLIPTGKI